MPSRSSFAKTAAVVLALAFTPCRGPEVVAAQDLKELARAARPSVVALEVRDRFGRTVGEGSGFFAGEKGLVVTNHHVIDTGSRVDAISADRVTFEVLGIVAVDRERDLAVLRVAGDDLPPPLELVRSETIEAGERVVVLGNPLGLSFTLSEGIVSAVRDDPEDLPEGQTAPLLQITAAISPGSSGSPVMNLDGQVVGVAVSQYVFGQNLNFAVPAPAVRELLARVDTVAEPRSLGGGPEIEIEKSHYVRNLVISLVFFVLLVVAFRFLR